MTATQTLTRDDLDDLTATKGRLDTEIRRLKVQYANSPDYEQAVDNLEDLLGAMELVYALLGTSLAAAGQLLAERDRLRSMAAHPAGKGRRERAGLRSV